MSRKTQFLAVKSIIAEFDVYLLSFPKLKTLLIKENKVLGKCSPARFAAMIRTVLKENTIDSDVIWHRH